MSKSAEAAAQLTVQEEVAIGPVAIKLMQGLLYAHFARRGPGRPRRNSEVPRLMRGFKSMVKASGVHLDAKEQQAMLAQLLNHSLF